MLSIAGEKGKSVGSLLLLLLPRNFFFSDNVRLHGRRRLPPPTALVPGLAVVDPRGHDWRKMVSGAEEEGSPVRGRGGEKSREISVEEQDLVWLPFQALFIVVGEEEDGPPSCEEEVQSEGQ